LKNKISNKPIIIGGFYRSGTSLVRRIFDSHQSFYCGPEVKFFKDFYADYLSDPLAHVRFFSSVRSMGLEEDQLFDVFGQSFVECHEFAAKKHGKRRWADKNPENVLYLEQWRRLLDDKFVFIHVVRNPLDALASLNEIGFKKAVPESFEAKIELYERYLKAAFDFQHNSPVETILLRYEDLASEPRNTLNELFQQLGESFDERIFELFYLPERNTGLEDPKVSETRNIHADSVGRWKRDLSELQWQEVIEKMSSWFTTLGYTHVL